MRGRTPPPRPSALLVLAVVLVIIGGLTLAGCASPAAEDGGGEAEPPVVLSAASAEPALERLAADPDVADVVSTMAPEYAGTSTLVSQIDSGRSFDVVFSASRRHMTELQDGGHIGGDPLPVATNRLVLAVPAENPGEIESFADFADRAEELTTAICAPQVPCGMLAGALSEELALDLHADTEETSVSSVLSKISLGEVDAGLVYRTDAAAAGEDVRTLEVPEHDGGTNQMWAGLSAAPTHPQAAEQLMGELASEDGRAAFEESGFLPPPAAESEDDAEDEGHDDGAASAADDAGS
ncbi:extracellular solute-binding protein [Nesterenkonia sp. F]|uniref:extracellular solute-binding protein n=1 Tax=Nesterenkonia sp. F TaxID=795955 RepID=UPI000255D518|nr:extracellular solute-binding protein [Nesterenkonia sp. F]